MRWRNKMDKLVSLLYTKAVDFGMAICYTVLTLTGIGLIFGVI